MHGTSMHAELTYLLSIQSVGEQQSDKKQCVSRTILPCILVVHNESESLERCGIQGKHARYSCLEIQEPPGVNSSARIGQFLGNF